MNTKEETGDRVYAVCVGCGAFKEFAGERCENCGLNPESDEQLLVKSVYLSVGRYDTEDDRNKYSIELRELAHRIRAGETIEYPLAEMTRLLEQKKQVDSVTPWHLLLYLARVFWPAIALIAVLFSLAFFLKWLRS